MSNQVYAHKNILCSQYRSHLLRGKIRGKLESSQKIMRDASVTPDSDMNEAQIRQSFILPLVAMLGWDVENPFEVWPEERAKGGFIDIRTKTMNGASLIWEIKRPSVDLSLSKESGREAAYQGVGYARTFNDSPYCIVTNFEVTHIFHSYQIPAVENIGQNLVATFTWEDLENGNADDILTVLEKGAVENLASRKFFDNLVKNRQIIRTSRPLQDSILVDLEAIRVLLAGNILGSSGRSSIDDIDLAVQTIINRLLFIRCCEDRKIIDKRTLLPLIDKVNSWKFLTSQIFPKFKSKFNSDIFKENRIADSRSLTITDDCVKSVLKKLYNAQGEHSNEVYDFSMISLEILGSAYESYLAKKLDVANNLVTLKTKPELKKSGGICYTPTHVVSAIVRRSLDEARKGKAIDQLKVLDPSCGSGTFLINAFHRLIQLHTPDPTKKSEFYEHPSLEKKIEILTHNIFGVDLDRNAVEISKLSLLLKILEGETAIPDDLDHVLPSLSRNIRHGNSLIDPAKAARHVKPKEISRLHPLDWEFFLEEIDANSGFDAIIGNPPYVRIQVLQEYYPVESAIYKLMYESAATGNFDLYIPFIERSMSLLNASGVLGFICPNRVFTNDYASNLREQISSQSNLLEIVNFRAEQVFTGVSTYTCLLFASKKPRETFNYIECEPGADLETFCLEYSNDALTNKTSAFNSKVLDEENWLLAPKAERDLILDLEKSSSQLSDFVSDRGAFQGLINGADDVYLLEVREDGSYYSKALDCEIEIEEEILVPVLKGSADLKRFRNPDIKLKMIFPYVVGSDDEISLISQRDIDRRFPLAMSYFRKCKKLLVSRKALKTKVQRQQDIKDNPTKFSSEDDWYYTGSDYYRFSRNQALSCVREIKLLAPSQFKKPTFFWDCVGEFSITGSGSGGGGAWGMFIKPEFASYAHAITAILSSSLLHKWFERRGDLFGGYYIGVDEKIILAAPMPDLNDPGLSDVIENLSKLAISILHCTDEDQFTELDNSIERLVLSLFEKTLKISITAA